MLCRSCRAEARVLIRQTIRLPRNGQRLLSLASQSSAPGAGLLPHGKTSRSSQLKQQIRPWQRRSITSLGAMDAMGFAEEFAERCTDPGKYTISHELRLADQVPKAEDGTELGTAEGPWMKDPLLNLPPTFSAWSQITMLHLYLLTARLRCTPPEAIGTLPQQLASNVFLEAERVMVENHAMTGASARQRYLKDLFDQWRGVIAAYDEGLARGDAVLASAVWRNLFGAREDIDARALAAVVAWMRRNLQRLEAMSDEQFFAAVKAPFVGAPAEELPLVDRIAKGMQSGGARVTGAGPETASA